MLPNGIEARQHWAFSPALLAKICMRRQRGEFGLQVARRRKEEIGASHVILDAAEAQRKAMKANVLEELFNEGPPLIDLPKRRSHSV